MIRFNDIFHLTCLNIFLLNVNDAILENFDNFFDSSAPFKYFFNFYQYVVRNMCLLILCGISLLNWTDQVRTIAPETGSRSSNYSTVHLDVMFALLTLLRL